jgi:hypothetical protein
MYLAWKDYGWSDTERLLPQIKELLGDITLVVVVFPIRDQMKFLNSNRDYVLYPQARITAICRNNKLPYLDLTETFYKSGGVDLYEDKLHLNENGATVAVEEISRWIKPSCASL